MRMAKKGPDLAGMAKRAWDKSKGITKAGWAEEDQSDDPVRKSLEDYVGTWRARLVRFGVQMAREIKAAGLDPDLI